MKNSTTYRIYLNGAIVDSSDLLGLAHMKYETAQYLGKANLYMIIEREDRDPVLSGVFIYTADCGWDYVCQAISPCPSDDQNCNYMRKPIEVPLQKNTLRVEIFTPSYKCGWNLKNGRIGGNNSDYHDCIRGN